MGRHDQLAIRPTILVPLMRPMAFLDIYSDKGRGEIVLPLSSNLGVGDACEIEIVFAREKMVICTRGTARWKRVATVRDLPAGIGVELAAGEERTRDLLLDFAAGRATAMIQRESRRFGVAIDVEYAASGQVANATTDDLSQGGCFIITTEPPPIGDLITIKLKPPGFVFGIALNAEVVWCRGGSERTGFGVKFVHVKKGAQAKLGELIERIRQQAAG